MSLLFSRFVVDKYIQRGKEWCNQHNCKESLEPIRCLEKWCSIVGSSVPPTSKRDDYSSLLKNVFNEIAETTCHDDTSRINFQLIYKFLAEILDGKHPSKLPKEETSVLFSLLNDLELLVSKDDFQEEVKFIKSGSWWKDKMLQDVDLNTPLLNQSQTTTSFSPPLEEQQSNEASQETVLSYLDLPKIRKIRECLNPLNIPVDLLAQRHSLINQNKI